jgi:outer membrane protein, heavy metal efflux system
MKIIFYMKKLIIIFTLQYTILQSNSAQVDIPFRYINLDYKEYIERVKAHNLEYAAEKLNINISEAAIEAAKIFQDPSISVDMTEDMEHRSRTGYGFSSELVKTIDLGGERKAKIDLTMSEKELSTALFSDYFRNLQAEATLVYLEGLKQKQLFMVRNDSYETMKKLYEADSIRLKLGSIMEIDAIQSKLEAGILLNELTHSLAEWKNSLFQISLMTGIANNDTSYLPSSHLHNVFRDFSLTGLITEAMNNRADLQAALHNKEVLQKALLLTRKERNTDVDMKVGFSNYYLTDRVSPRSTGLTAGIAIPLKFSNFNKGDMKKAEIRVQQADILFQQAELQIATEINQAWELYQGFCKQVQNFNKGLLDNAESVRKGKIYSYQRGESSLLEVLNAQRSFNEIQTTYYDTLFNQAAALVELEKAAGIWDIDF